MLCRFGTTQNLDHGCLKVMQLWKSGRLPPCVLRLVLSRIGHRTDKRRKGQRGRKEQPAWSRSTERRLDSKGRQGGQEYYLIRGAAAFWSERSYRVSCRGDEQNHTAGTNKQVLGDHPGRIYTGRMFDSQTARVFSSYCIFIMFSHDLFSCFLFFSKFSANYRILNLKCYLLWFLEHVRVGLLFHTKPVHYIFCTK